MFDHNFNYILRDWIFNKQQLWTTPCGPLPEETSTQPSSASRHGSSDNRIQISVIISLLYRLSNCVIPVTLSTLK